MKAALCRKPGRNLLKSLCGKRLGLYLSACRTMILHCLVLSFQLILILDWILHYINRGPLLFLNDNPQSLSPAPKDERDPKMIPQNYSFTTKQRNVWIAIGINEYTIANIHVNDSPRTDIQTSLFYYKLYICKYDRIQYILLNLYMCIYVICGYVRMQCVWCLFNIV